MPVNRMITARWRDEYICTAEITQPGLRAAVYRSAGAGGLVRVARGVYLPTAVWRGLDAEGRHLAQIRATALTHPGAVFSHLSAALLWGLPVVGPLPAVPHVLAPVANGGRSKTGIVRHCVGVPERVEVLDGVKVADLSRTVLDCVTSAGLDVALPIADAALVSAGFVAPGGDRVRLDRDALLDALGDVPMNRGSARGRIALELADGRSGSPGESLSRASMHIAGMPAPELQAEFRDRTGRIGFVDFWWPEARLVGEFDGHAKYVREEFLRGRRGPPPAALCCTRARKYGRACN